MELRAKEIFLQVALVTLLPSVSPACRGGIQGCRQVMLWQVQSGAQTFDIKERAALPHIQKVGLEGYNLRTVTIGVALILWTLTHKGFKSVFNIFPISRSTSLVMTR